MFTGLAVSADSQASDILDRTDSETISTADLAEFRDRVDDRDERRTMALVFAGVGGGLALMSAALYVFDNPQIEAGPPTRAGPPAATPARAAPTGGVGAPAPADRTPDRDTGDIPWGGGGAQLTPVLGPDTIGFALSGRF